MPSDRDEILQAVSSAVLAVTRHLSVREVLQVIVRSAQRLLDARYAALGVPDEDGSFAEFVAEGLTDKQWDAIGPLPRQHGMLGAMLRDGTPVRLPDLRKDPRFEWWPKAHPVMKDFLGVPIRDGEQVLGIIFLANKRTGGGFSQEDQELLTLFAAHAAIALTNARLYERGRELAMLEERNRMARSCTTPSPRSCSRCACPHRPPAPCWTRPPTRPPPSSNGSSGWPARPCPSCAR
ncbi:GAF domain-containing protein [Nonomuraea rubra]|uniref:GAF domain-containing protein n=1 Tax=Nonomuraea rubra TaxID=46180 RepID=UPI0036187B47